MRYSQLFGKTVKGSIKGVGNVSTDLLYKAGFIRESTAGRYFILPLGEKIQQKIISIIKEEMDKVGAQEMLSPVLHPLSLWKETNRDKTTGFELMTVNDRNGVTFALGGTAEEMFVDVVRKFQISYKELPFNLYQFSSKFRDELRPRGGLLRVREFIMKDAYSFDCNENEFKKQYQKMWLAYTKIFKRMGLETIVVESDNGYIGGEYCHEFVVESEAGESQFFITSTSGYAAHQEVARFYKEIKNTKEPFKNLQEVEAKRGTSMEDGAKLHKKPIWQQIKDVLFVDDKDRFILVVIRGDFDVNETKLRNLIKANSLRPATDEEIRKKINSEPGFLSPVRIKEIIDKNIQLFIVADDSLRTIRNTYGGANKRYRDLLNINIGRDYQADIEGDVALAQPGFLTEDGQQKLIKKRGIEVGNIFQLGYHYSSRLKDATFINKDGQAKPYYMGCYGIGIGRTMATIVEKYHDKCGIIWPKTVTPYQVHLVGLVKQDVRYTDLIYRTLISAGIDVLYDDRVDVSPGEKLTIADLIGIPIRLIISEKTKTNIEWKERSEEKKKLLSVAEIIEKVRQFYLI